MYGTSVWNFLNVAFLAPRILKWLLDNFKFFAGLV